MRAQTFSPIGIPNNNQVVKTVFNASFLPVIRLKIKTDRQIEKRHTINDRLYFISSIYFKYSSAGLIEYYSLMELFVSNFRPKGLLIFLFFSKQEKIPVLLDLAHCCVSKQSPNYSFAVYWRFCVLWIQTDKIKSSFIKFVWDRDETVIIKVLDQF